jgi:hypothetical protein
MQMSAHYYYTKKHKYITQLNLIYRLKTRNKKVMEITGREMVTLKRMVHNLPAIAHLPGTEQVGSTGRSNFHPFGPLISNWLSVINEICERQARRHFLSTHLTPSTYIPGHKFSAAVEQMLKCQW